MTDPIDYLAELPRQRSGEIDPADDRASREAMIANLESRETKARWSRPQLGLAAAAMAMALTILVLAWPESTLDYAVTGANVEDGYVRAQHESAQITFSDGTRFTLEAGSAGRIVSTSEEGARVLLEQGEAHFSVIPLEGARWFVGAGPFSIAVTGTEFNVSWSAQEQQLEVELIEGSIRVTGPMAESGMDVRAGQRLVANVGARQLNVADAQSVSAAVPTAPTTSSATARVAPVSPSTSPVLEPTAAASTVAAPATWGALIAEGKYAEVMRLARTRGIGSVLSGGTMGELVALGDAARYTGDGGTSREVLLALRKRFPSSPSAKTAAFLLGRMAEGGSGAGAIRWYDRYLSESPNGTYASEAMGRKLVLLSRTNPGAARSLAEQYLRTYPRGGYAKVAKQILKR